ncbi:MAG TPA: hypothetical protein VHD76_22965 [Bryobacteraceae bacterium]|nr:hypothetical protein [Bryobacteraceae bacterium]
MTLRTQLIPALLALGLITAGGCQSPQTYRWQAYRIDGGFEVDVYLFPSELTLASAEEQVTESDRVAERIAVRVLEHSGFVVQQAKAISFSGARGGAVVGVVAGRMDFVQKAEEMGKDFWAYADLQHRKIAASGGGQLATVIGR